MTPEEISQALWDHNHAHVCSNNPGGHICDRWCVSQFLAQLLKRELAALMPEATETVEWEKRLVWNGCHCGHPGLGCYCRETLQRTGRRRTRTKYADRVTDWEEVGDE